MITIYTDGGCQGNPGPGGWGTIVLQDGERIEYSGREPRTTNNRMELQGAIEGLLRTPEGSEVTLSSDSQYLVYTMTRGWKRNKNLDLWEKLDSLTASRKVKWAWLQDFQHPEMECAHQLATGKAGNAESKKPFPAPPTSIDGVAPTQQSAAVPALTHLDERGHARMVDVSPKAETEREAIARGRVLMQPATLKLLQEGKVEKGDALAVARLAGISAAKDTSRLIPLAHPLPLTQVAVHLALDEANSAVDIEARAKTVGRTGVEMEALVAVSMAALALYDMLKAADRAMHITDIRLVRKSGGKSGTFVAE